MIQPAPLALLASALSKFLSAAIHSAVVLVMRFVVFFEIAAIFQRQFSSLHSAIFLFYGNKFAPLEWVHLREIDSVKIKKPAAGFTRHGCTQNDLGVGQSLTQVPQYQHSSGCRMIGHLPSCGLGMKTSTGQRSTQVLQPSHMSGLKIAGLPGVAAFGRAQIFMGFSVSKMRELKSKAVRIAPIIARCDGFASLSLRVLMRAEKPRRLKDAKPTRKGNA